MSLADAIAEALANAEPPPPNESTTCEWIIYPLLLAAGYARRDIVSRIADNNGQFPDYTILPDSPHTWFLEAKAWKSPLQDAHAQQAMTYAYSNGKRWVILTNGRSWRLYDSTIHGVSSDRFITEAQIGDSSLVNLLSSFRKESFQLAGVEAFARKCLEARSASQRRDQLRTLLDTQLKMQDSNLVKAVWKYARSQPGLSSVTRTEIVEALRRDTPARNPEATGEDTNNDTVRKELPNGSATSRSTSNREVIRARTTDAKIATLQELLVAGHSGNKFMFPGIVDFPDGTRIDTRSWQEAAQKIVEWIGQHGERPPLPFKGLESRYRYFINSESMHSDRPMDYAGKVQWGDGFAYVHANQGAIEYIRSLHKLCLQAGIPPDRLRLHMMPWGNAATKPL